jgi:hypothetical protein
MIDEEIREALDVDPSPDFLARLRTRIATEPAPSSWRRSWTMATAGALAAAVLVAIALTPRAKTIVEPVTQTAAAGPSLSEGRPGPVGPGRTDSAPATATRKLRPVPIPVVSGFSRTTLSASRQSEILLDASETRALQQLIAGVRDGHVDLTAAQESSSPAPMDLEPIAEIVIAPIRIEPLAPQGAQGEQP